MTESTPRLHPCDESPVEPQRSTGRRPVEVAAAFLKLGCVSFGGPVAHLGHLRTEFVERRRWLDDAQYADLVALCQFLPGPASSQVVFALGMRQAGLAGALIASACFTLPSALLMIGLAYGLAQVPDLGRAGWLHGLKLAAVAVVAQAVWGMGRKLCPDGPRVVLCLGTAALMFVNPGVPTQLGALVFGGFIGGWLSWGEAPVGKRAPDPPFGRAKSTGAASLAAYAVLLATLPLIASWTNSHAWARFDAFYRAGALVFGGGHVVLPLLRAELVPRGWMDDQAFLSGYAAAQALPGPLFAFSAYLGAAMNPGAPSWQSGLGSLLALFLPGWLLIAGALPFWHRLRSEPRARALLAGANAAVVGLLLAAFCDPVVAGAVHTPSDAVVGLLAFGLLEWGKVAPGWVVAACAAVGALGPCW